MRYYLDTNILVFLLSESTDDLHFSIRDSLYDYSNTLFAGSIAISELAFLYRTGKVGKDTRNSERDVLSQLEKLGIEVVLFNLVHFEKYMSMSIVENHKDIIDHMIIAQAISDRISLISSDHTFEKYVSQGLDFVFNRR